MEEILQKLMITEKPITKWVHQNKSFAITAIGLKKGNTLKKHLIVHQKVGLDQKHFDRWLSLWHNTLNQHFEGSCTETAKQRAQHMSQVLLLHIKKS
jgi:truncated hemoglobin YjbI